MSLLSYTIVQTAKLNGLNPEAYLNDILTRISAGHPINRLAELMPWHLTAAGTSGVILPPTRGTATVPASLPGICRANGMVRSLCRSSKTLQARAL